MNTCITAHQKHWTEDVQYQTENYYFASWALQGRGRRSNAFSNGTGAGKSGSRRWCEAVVPCPHQGHKLFCVICFFMRCCSCPASFGWLVCAAGQSGLVAWLLVKWFVNVTVTCSRILFQSWIRLEIDSSTSKNINDETSKFINSIISCLNAFDSM